MHPTASAILVASQSDTKTLGGLFKASGVCCRVFRRMSGALSRIDESDACVLVLTRSVLSQSCYQTFGPLSAAFCSPTYLIADSSGQVSSSSPPPGTIDLTALPPEEAVRIISTAIKSRSAESILPSADRKAIAEAQESKTRFLATVSHEMRTPLTSIREFASLVKDEVAGPVTEDQAELLEGIISNVSHLTTIIEDMLQISEFDAGRLRLLIEPLDPADVAREVMAQIGRSFSGRATLRLVTPEGLPSVAADRVRLKQVLLNLVSNALKFTPASGQVTIRISRVASGVRVAVKDTGCGIPTQHQSRIFDRFYQVPVSGGPSRKGSGLGLAIAQEIATAHGSLIRLASKPGKGCRFWLDLPIFTSKEEPDFRPDRAEPGPEPLVVSIRLRTPSENLLVPAELLAVIAQGLQSMLSPGEHAICLPVAGRINLVLQCRPEQAQARRDKVIRRLQRLKCLDWQRYTVEVGLEAAA